MFVDGALEGLSYRLRPVQVADAAFMVGLRRRDGVRQCLHPTSDSVQDQVRWIEQRLGSENDFTFILEDRFAEAAVGAFSVYDVDRGKARIGRWIMQPGSRAVPEFAILGYGTCFGRMRLGRVYCQIPENNRRALAFQERIRSEPRGVVGTTEIDGRRLDLLGFETYASAWPDMLAALMPCAVRAHRSRCR